MPNQFLCDDFCTLGEMTFYVALIGFLPFTCKIGCSSTQTKKIERMVIDGVSGLSTDKKG